MGFVANLASFARWEIFGYGYLTVNACRDQEACALEGANHRYLKIRLSSANWLRKHCERFHARSALAIQTSEIKVESSPHSRDPSMPLKLYYHPLASFCWKVLIALYENAVPFEPVLVDLGNEASRAAFLKVWPIGKFPVLRDEAADRTIPESSTIIEYLAQHYPGRTPLVPADADLARQTRLRDRFYDHYVHEPMQKIVTDKIRPAGKNDPFGVEQAKALLRTSYAMIDQEMGTKVWAMGDAFSMADCAASPALYYANLVLPLGEEHKNTKAYLERLTQRPSFARVIQEAQPYFHMFPGVAGH